jgi:hypothetical protein
MKYVIPLELIELEEDNYHLTISAQFESGSEGLWVIDTGASKTVFSLALTENYTLIKSNDQKLVKSAGIGSDHLETLPGILHPFRIGECDINRLEVALIDLSHINALYYHAAEKEICGLIGSDFLMQYHAIINYPRLQMTLVKRKKKKLFPFSADHLYLRPHLKKPVEN